VVVSLAVEGLTVRSNFMLLDKKFLIHASCLELYLLTVSGKGNRRANMPSNELRSRVLEI